MRKRERDGQEEEGDDHPGDKVDAEGVVLLAAALVGVRDAGAGDEERGVGQPEGAVRRERCPARNRVSASVNVKTATSGMIGRRSGKKKAGDVWGAGGRKCGAVRATHR